jgi:nucleoside-diphosphate-sugar epimerase
MRGDMLSLVTGGAGFLGSHLVDTLIARGDEVIIVDNLSSGSLRNIDGALTGGRATFVYLDVGQPLCEIREPIVKAARYNPIGQIFHMASPASPDAYGARPWETLCVNAVGTMALIDLALEQHSRLIYASTSEIYGDPLVHPQPESYFGNVDPIGPRACYDEGKRFGEAALSVAVSRRGLDGRIVRFFNCYGPRMSNADGRLIAALSDAVMANLPLPIHGDGRQTRSMTFVDDAIRLLMIVASAPQSELAPVNIGSDEERTVLDIAETFARLAGVRFAVKHLEPRPGDPRRRRPDLTKARSMGYAPRTTLDDGLATTIAWLRNSAGAYV